MSEEIIYTTVRPIYSKHALEKMNAALRAEVERLTAELSEEKQVKFKLRKIIHELEETQLSKSFDELKREIARLAARNAELTAALSEIIDYDKGETWPEIIADLRDIARAALKGEK